MVATDALLKHVHTHTDIISSNTPTDTNDLIYLNPEVAKGDSLDGLANPFEGLNEQERSILASKFSILNAIRTLKKLSKAKSKKYYSELTEEDKNFFAGEGNIHHYYYYHFTTITIIYYSYHQYYHYHYFFIR